MDRRADGSFDITFESPPKRPHHESGRWKVQGDVYTTLTLTVEAKPVDLHDPQFVDVYRLRDVTSDSVSYFHLRTGILHKSTRVPCPDPA